jgi:methylenetetrahydrofolate dehydrogenase (NADP+)/methenyltetrahydrofolate cyclohydrolase
MIIDGKKIAAEIEGKLKQQLEGLPQKKVAFVLFGENFVSRKFMGMKKSLAKRIGVAATIFEKPMMENAKSLTTDDAITFIQSIAGDFDGIVIQLPLPESLDAEKIVASIPLEKDIDLLSTKAMEKYRSGGELEPPVARAVFEILKYHDVGLAEKNIVVIGNGKLVGAPVAAMLEREALKNPAITFSQIRRSTPEAERLAAIKNADIIISGVGEPHFIKPEMVKDGVVLIDAGTSEQAGKLAGDIDPACAEKASLMTPVPGGVGPVTVACLFLNLL